MCDIAYKEIKEIKEIKMTKHTPAPWTVKEAQGQTFVAAQPYEGHPYFGCSSTIEIMSDEDYPTKEADASLISAAPDLLEACKAIHNATTQAQLDNAVKLIANAIKKAEGR